MREYADYCADCLEYGGQPVTEEEFNELLKEEKELK